MSLELIVGPMFSGKSTELIRRVQRLQTIGKSLAIYNSVNDDRYGIDGVYTHDMKSVQCITTDTLMSQLHTSAFKNADYIFIDEAQFFKDLFNFKFRRTFPSCSPLYRFSSSMSQVNAYCAIFFEVRVEKLLYLFF